MIPIRSHHDIPAMVAPVNAIGLRFHHLGLAARRPEEAKRFLGALGYKIGEVVFDPEQNVNLLMCRHKDAMPDVEIIYPAAGKSPVDRFLDLRPGGLVYHLCYATDNLGVTLAKMEQNSIRAVCVAPPTPAILFSGCRVSFYNIVGMGLCEIIEDPDGMVV